MCLSPQRRSFGSGCSWKETPSSTGTGTTSTPAPATTPSTSGQDDFLSEERDDLFIDMEGPPPSGSVQWGMCAMALFVVTYIHLHTIQNTHTHIRTGSRPSQPPNFPSGPPFQGLPHTSHHTPRVINHIPLQDRERGDRRNWREKDSEKNSEWQSHRGHKYQTVSLPVSSGLCLPLCSNQGCRQRE